MNNLRLIGLLAILAGVVAFIALGPKPNASEALPAVSTPIARTKQASSPVSNGEKAKTQLLALRPRRDYGTGGDAFQVQEAKPIPVVAPVALSPIPLEPMNPFEVIGKQRVGDHYTIFLSKGDETYAVTQDTLFADNYRVDSIEPPRLKVTYLPMSQQFEINIGVFD
jgi:hypothetical protein